MDEAHLTEQLHEIEHRLASSGAGAENARAVLARYREREADKEFEISIPSTVAQRVLVGWCQRIGVEPYRKPRQRMTKVCLRVPRSFMHEVLWPQVEAMSAVLEQATDAAVDRIVTQWSGEPLKQYDGSQAELFE
jgi:hypothetical protein